MRIFEEKQWFNQWWVHAINLSLLGALFYFLYKWYIAGEHVDKVSATDYSGQALVIACLLYTSPSPRDKRQSRMPSSA